MKKKTTKKQSNRFEAMDLRNDAKKLELINESLNALAEEAETVLKRYEDSDCYHIDVEEFRTAIFEASVEIGNVSDELEAESDDLEFEEGGI